MTSHYAVRKRLKTKKPVRSALSKRAREILARTRAARAKEGGR